MRLSEFQSQPLSTPESNLATALVLLRQRYKDQTTPAKISTKALINLVLNTDRTFDYDALVAANENNPTIKNLIKSFNKDYVELASVNDQSSEKITNVANTTTQNPVDTVNDMAKRAAKTRGAPVA